MPPRRAERFLAASALTAALVLGGSAYGAEDATPRATLIFHNGVVLTMDTKRPRAQAVATRNGAILAVGTSKAVLRTRGSGTRVVDLRGRTLLPGFVDAHRTAAATVACGSTPMRSRRSCSQPRHDGSR